MVGREHNIGCLSGTLTRVGKGLQGRVYLASTHLKGTFSHVCSSNKTDKLYSVLLNSTMITNDTLLLNGKEPIVEYKFVSNLTKIMNNFYLVN